MSNSTPRTADFINADWTQVDDNLSGANVRVQCDEQWMNDDDGTAVFVKRGWRSGVCIGARRSNYNGHVWLICRWTYKGHTFTSGMVNPSCVAFR